MSLENVKFLLMHTPETSDIQFTEEVENFASRATASLPATAQRLQEIRNAQKSDEECSQVRRFCQEGWPLYMPQQPLLRPYWEHRAHQVVVDDLLLHSQLCSISSRQKVVDTPLREPCWTTKSSNTFERHAVRATGHRSLSQVTGDAFGIGDI